MKKLILWMSVLLASYSHLYAQTKSCCELTLSKQNALLAMNDDFARIHQEPLPYTLENPKGEMVKFNTPDGKTANAYLIKAAKPSKKYLFVFHEWWGLNDYIKKEAEHLYETLAEVNVLAIDMYNGNVATTREEAQKLVSSVDQQRLTAIINGAFSYAGKGSKVATLGWCMGGSWSLQAAIIGDKPVKACVIYYGFPEMNIDKLKKINCDMLGIFAEKDQHINVETVKAFENKLKEAGKQIVVYNYVAEHAFANPSNPAFNAEATKDAFDKVTAYLRKNMNIKK